MIRSIRYLIVVAGLVLPQGSQAKERSEAGSTRVVALAIAPARLVADQEGPALLVRAEEQTDGDGAAFYGKAARALPTTLDSQQLSEWTRVPLRDLPRDEAQGMLDQARESLELVAQGAGCKGCTWPAFVPGTMPAFLSEYRQLAFLLCLKARLEIVQGQYDKAIETIRTGLTMSKHIGECPTAVQGMVGVAMAALLLRAVEDLAQTRGAPNLYPALHALPKPLVDLEVPMSSELKNLESNKQYNWLARGALRRHLEDSHRRIRALMHRLDGTVAALQCVEALRHYAAGHDGALPARLGEIADVQVPDDPASQKPFAYRREGDKAVLDVPAPKDGSARDAIRYEITVAR